MQTIYIETKIKNHPRVKKILSRFPNAKTIPCDNYQEVFNKKSQNFRIQKQNPALILAEKTGKRVLPTPEGFGIGGQQNYYFSHLLNCPYDCRYCFLQGMYQSANYVLFVNYEDFMQEIKSIASQNPTSYFFSGYDADSLAFESATGFLQEFLPFFAKTENAILELRSKSTNIRELLKQPSFDNCIAAFSFTPQTISSAIEHKVPSVEKRINAIKKLADHGWQIGLRFDPLIYHESFEQLYTTLFESIFTAIDPSSIHSVSTGPLRFPRKMFDKIKKLYPYDPLTTGNLTKQNNHYAFEAEQAAKMKQCVLNLLEQYIPKSLVFECNVL